MGITILLFFILFMLDQILKFIMLKADGPIIIGVDAKNYFIKLERVFNDGAAFGLGKGNIAGTIIFTVISFIATIALIIICTKFNNWKRNKTQAVALTMALAGCVGNLYDRFLTSCGVNFLSTVGEATPGANSGVVDMVYFYPFEWLMGKLNLGYGIFNLADLFLVTGICLFAFDFIFFYERKKRKWEESR